jgi:hypothetical protein
VLAARAMPGTALHLSKKFIGLELPFKWRKIQVEVAL